ncbi:dienelactone hydrolase family protein [Achromobacter pestifer]|uniref:Dienelactone hydrolase family protein n=1 Tax=Achromobacter pestifer TaxID=1353889 RepID=A0A7D4HUZ2_9BURK|nr:dienelactone hydrolase family protein [Achromobacter pestifer]QKH34040.1 dienelactone hydrolase family protein [Achromobacter pestifer]
MKIAVSDGAFDAYVARPDAASAPVVVVIQEIFGVNADLRTTCDELAAKGFIAISPDLFWRAGPGIEFNKLDEQEWQRGFELYKGFDFDRGVKDIVATIDAARSIAGGSGKVAVMGFCLGGLMAYLVAARGEVDAAVAYYGGGTDNHLNEADQVTAPLLMHLAEEDEYIPADAQARVKAALGGRAHIEIHGYRGCNHAFARHGGSHYDVNAAALANQRTETFLRRTLGA